MAKAKPRGAGIKPIEKYQLQNLPPERRREIAKMGAEARKKKKEENMALQRVLRELLNMRISSQKQKQVLKQMGFTDKDLQNKTLLMVALFRKGLTGDVSAIREITTMMDKLDLYSEGKDVRAQQVTINIVSEGEEYEPTEQDKEDIWKAENGIFSNEPEMQEEEDDWGTDVYEG